MFADIFAYTLSMKPFYKFVVKWQLTNIKKISLFHFLELRYCLCVSI